MTVGLPNPVNLTQQNIARLRRYVDALEAEASITWGDEPTSADLGIVVRLREIAAGQEGA